MLRSVRLSEAVVQKADVVGVHIFFGDECVEHLAVISMNGAQKSNLAAVAGVD